MKIEIEISDNLGAYSFDEDGNPISPVSVEEKITNALVERLIQSNAISYKRISESVAEKVMEYTDERIKAVVDEVFDGNIQKTDWAGNPLGEPVTVRSLITDRIKKWDKIPNKRYSYGDKTSLGSYIEQTVKEMMRTELKPQVDKARELVTETVTEATVKAIAESLSK